jgi:hypothetical protein
LGQAQLADTSDAADGGRDTRRKEQLLAKYGHRSKRLCSSECIAVVNVDWHGYANALSNVPASSILTRD